MTSDSRHNLNEPLGLEFKWVRSESFRANQQTRETKK
jgi:hypothetical protein